MEILDITYLQECVVSQVLITNKLCNFIFLYRSLSQPTDTFDQFAENLELILDEVANHNSFLIVALDDFNVKSQNWCKHDETSYERVKIDTLTSQFGLQQIIKEPTHILAESSYCIALIFMSYQNLVMESGVHPSLNPNCHHQIIYAKFNLKIQYPATFKREIWHYDQANVDHIRKAVDLFPWEKNIKKSQHKQYDFFI